MLTPDDAHYSMVAKRISDGKVIPFLGAGVGLCGRPRGACWRRGEYLPNGAELAERLAAEFSYPSTRAKIQCTNPNCRQQIEVSEKPPDLVTVSQYGAITLGSGVLYEKLRPVFDANYPPTLLHHFFARLPAVLREKGYSRPCQLIITTNYDDLMERAFRAAGEPFDLVTYMSEGVHRGKFVHRDPDGVDHLIEKPNEYTGFSPEQRSAILKIHGTIDRSNPDGDSFVITEDHYIDYLSRTDLASLVPVQLAAKIRTGHHFLFLGYGLRDWNLRVILHRIWGERKLDIKSWAIQLNPGKIDQEYWIKREVDILNLSLENYLAALDQQIRALPKAGGTS